MNIADTITYVVFGATGNLSRLKIFPALCTLMQEGVLSKDFVIIACSRRDLDNNSYRDFIRQSLNKFDEKIVSEFISHILYVGVVFEDNNLYSKIKEKIKGGKVFFHLAVMPESYQTIIRGIGGAGMLGSVLIEKPFGYSGESADELERVIESFFPEECIYRIDHYLGKIGVKAIIDKKISDPVFESSLNNEKVSRIVCRFREVVDISDRGEFYDGVGAFLDMGQSHGLEVLATTLMDSNKDINLARQEVLESFVYIPRSFIRGQYEGYKNEKGVKENSETETYFKVMLGSTGDRWSNVEIVLEAGKALESDNRKEEVIIQYIDGGEFVFDIDTPKHFNAYETVIRGALQGDKSVFVSMGEISALWRCADEIKSSVGLIPLINYKKGSGPDLTSN